jgi:putative phosphoesterase
LPWQNPVRIGIVADIHCNHEALAIALERMGPVDELLCAGDAVYQFRFSNEVMELLRRHHARYVLGNHEEVLLGRWGERARNAPSVRRENLAYMQSQPFDLDVRLNGRRLYMVHGSPWEPHDEYIYPNSLALIRVGRIGSDFVILGHTHYHMAERVGRSLVINPGSCGEARDHRNGFCLSYAILDMETEEVTFDHFEDPTRALLPPPKAGAGRLSP